MDEIMEALQGGHLSTEQVTVLDAKRRGMTYDQIEKNIALLDFSRWIHWCL
jgi:hypothetical protein